MARRGYCSQVAGPRGGSLCRKTWGPTPTSRLGGAVGDAMMPSRVWEICGTGDMSICGTWTDGPTRVLQPSCRAQGWQLMSQNLGADSHVQARGSCRRCYDAQQSVGDLWYR